MLYFYPTLLEKYVSDVKFCITSLCGKLKILSDSVNKDRFHHNHFVLEIGLSERLRLKSVKK